FKIPAGATVPRYSPLPCRVHWRNSAGSSERNFVQHFRLGDVGEGEALGSESNFRPTHIFERSHIGADSEIIRYSASCAERQIPAARSRWDVRNTRTTPCSDPRKFFAEEGPSAQCGVQAEHTDLLFDLRIPADDCSARVPRYARKLGFRFGAHTIAKCGIFIGIIHIREHHVLPD